jgi:hypothetical protein
MQQVEFALSVIPTGCLPTGCLSAMIAKLPCHVVLFTAFLRVLATPEVVQMIFTSWSSHKLFFKRAPPAENNAKYQKSSKRVVAIYEFFMPNIFFIWAKVSIGILGSFKRNLQGIHPHFGDSEIS